jgi:hypothetical protein
MFPCDFKYIPCFAALMSVSLLHAVTDVSLLPDRHDAAHSPINKTTTPTNDGPPRFAHDDLVIFLSSCIISSTFLDPGIR